MKPENIRFIIGIGLLIMSGNSIILFIIGTFYTLAGISGVDGKDKAYHQTIYVLAIIYSIMYSIYTL
jgi:hypothetical protein